MKSNHLGHRIHIFGSAGSGTTTLGIELSKKLNIPHFDSDDYFWKKTDPPYIEKNPIPERHRLLLQDMKDMKSWVLSGAIDSWAEPFIPLFSLAVFIYVPAQVRINRLKLREHNRYGDRILPSGDMYQTHLDFIEWAAQYDEGRMSGRSLKRHEEWIKNLPCPIVRIEGDVSVDRTITLVLQELK